MLSYARRYLACSARHLGHHHHLCLKAPAVATVHSSPVPPVHTSSCPVFMYHILLHILCGSVLAGLLPPPPRSLLRQPSGAPSSSLPQGPSSSYSSLQSHATYNSMATQMGSAYASPCPTPTQGGGSRASSRHGWTSRRKYSTSE